MSANEPASLDTTSRGTVVDPSDDGGDSAEPPRRDDEDPFGDGRTGSEAIAEGGDEERAEATGASSGEDSTSTPGDRPEGSGSSTGRSGPPALSVTERGATRMASPERRARQRVSRNRRTVRSAPGPRRPPRLETAARRRERPEEQAFDDVGQAASRVVATSPLGIAFSQRPRFDGVGETVRSARGADDRFAESVREQTGLPREDELAADLRNETGLPSEEELSEGVNEEAERNIGFNPRGEFEASRDRTRDDVVTGVADIAGFARENPTEAAVSGLVVGAALAEPTPAGEVLLLGGAGVGAIGGDILGRAREQSELDVPEQGPGERSELEPGEGRPTSELEPGEGAGQSELQPGEGRPDSEIPIPDRNAGESLFRTSQLRGRQRGRQTERERASERARQRTGAEPELLDEILQGPEEDVSIGEPEPGFEEELRRTFPTGEDAVVGRSIQAEEATMPELTPTIADSLGIETGVGGQGDGLLGGAFGRQEDAQQPNTGTATESLTLPVIEPGQVAEPTVDTRVGVDTDQRTETIPQTGTRTRTDTQTQPDVQDPTRPYPAITEELFEERERVEPVGVAPPPSQPNPSSRLRFDLPMGTDKKEDEPLFGEVEDVVVSDIGTVLYPGVKEP